MFQPPLGMLQLCEFVISGRALRTGVMRVGQHAEH
jgi:hypothetical protein